MRVNRIQIQYLYGVSLCSSCSGWLVQSSQWLKLRTFCSHRTMLVSWIIFSCHIASFILIYSKVTEGSSNTFKILSHHSLSQRSLSITFFYIFFHFLFHSFSIRFFLFVLGIFVCAGCLCTFVVAVPLFCLFLKDVTMCCIVLMA